jgi:hypothetical protein
VAKIFQLFAKQNQEITPNQNKYEKILLQPEKTTCSIVLRVEGYLVVPGIGRMPVINPVRSGGLARDG